nr:hypothetical protein BaRGS_004169 [Batillaria attramentaria]
MASSMVLGLKDTHFYIITSVVGCMLLCCFVIAAIIIRRRKTEKRTRPKKSNSDALVVEPVGETERSIIETGECGEITLDSHGDQEESADLDTHLVEQTIMEQTKPARTTEVRMSSPDLGRGKFYGMMGDDAGKWGKAGTLKDDDGRILVDDTGDDDDDDELVMIDNFLYGERETHTET